MCKTSMLWPKRSYSIYFWRNSCSSNSHKHNLFCGGGLATFFLLFLIFSSFFHFLVYFFYLFVYFLSLLFLYFRGVLFLIFIKRIFNVFRERKWRWSKQTYEVRKKEKKSKNRQRANNVLSLYAKMPDSQAFRWEKENESSTTKKENGKKNIIQRIKRLFHCYVGNSPPHLVHWHESKIKILDSPLKIIIHTRESKREKI